MGKFKQGFAVTAKEELKKEEEQKKLHEKYKAEENMLIVERDNMVKFLVRLTAVLFRLTTTIAIILLAAIGILCLVYPQIRAELLDVLQMVFADARKMTGL